MADEQAFGVHGELDALAGELRRRGVAVGLEDHPVLAVEAGGHDHAAVVGEGRQGQQRGLLQLEQLQRRLVGGAVDPDVGHVLHPLPDAVVQRRERETLKVEAVQVAGT